MVLMNKTPLYPCHANPLFDDVSHHSPFCFSNNKGIGRKTTISATIIQENKVQTRVQSRTKFFKRESKSGCKLRKNLESNNKRKKA